MTDTILVTYASRTGTTAGIAEQIGTVLTQQGIPTDILPMEQVQDVRLYRAVVAGSAIQDKKWLPEAMSFIDTHRSVLVQKPFAAFLVCMTLAMPNKNYRKFVAEWLEPVRTQVPTISEGLFAGNLDISKVPTWKDRLMFRITVWLRVWSEDDHRDWDKVRAWANELADVL